MANIYDASVIIPTYNRKEILNETLNALVNQKYDKEKFEVIICDDGSNDNTKEMLYEFQNKLNLRYLYQEDKGFRAARARNMGIRYSQGRVCIFIDAGIVAGPNFINEHLKLHKNYKDIVIGNVLGFDQYGNNRDSILNLYNREDIDGSIEKLRQNNIEDIRDNMYRLFGEDLSKWEAPWIIFWTSNVSVNRNFLLECGMFDEWFNSWGGEDTDLGVNLYTNGGIFKYRREALAIDYPHKKENSFESNMEFAIKEQWLKSSYIHNKYKLLSTLAFKYIDTSQINIFLKDYSSLKKEDNKNGKLL